MTERRVAATSREARPRQLTQLKTRMLRAARELAAAERLATRLALVDVEVELHRCLARLIDAQRATRQSDRDRARVWELQPLDALDHAPLETLVPLA
jgi:hypothetical protein